MNASAPACPAPAQPFAPGQAGHFGLGGTLIDAAVDEHAARRRPD